MALLNSSHLESALNDFISQTKNSIRIITNIPATLGPHVITDFERCCARD